MSLLAFQHAMADLAASPDFCLAVRADAQAALAGYDLTPVEHRRVASAAAQQGIKVNCTLHRSNRFSTVVAMLPGTVHLIGAETRATADRFWAENPVPDFTTRRELHRFGRFVRRSIDEGVLDGTFLREVLDYELNSYDLGMVPPRRSAAAVAEAAERWPDGPLALHPQVRVCPFRHEPAVLLPLVRTRPPLPWEGVPEGEFYLLLDARHPPRRVPLDVPTGRLLASVADGADVRGRDGVEALVGSGILVRTAPAAEPVAAA
ncbi:MAG TPA: hypothetical protein VF541_14555 [Longimicrobium sp.]